MLHFVQHDKMRPRGHRLGVINARSGRFVAVSSGKSKLRSSIVEDNVQKTSFSYPAVRLVVDIQSTVSGTCRARNPICLDHPSLAGWLNRDKSSNYLWKFMGNSRKYRICFRIIASLFLNLLFGLSVGLLGIFALSILANRPLFAAPWQRKSTLKHLSAKLEINLKQILSYYKPWQ